MIRFLTAATPPQRRALLAAALALLLPETMGTEIGADAAESEGAGPGARHLGR